MGQEVAIVGDVDECCQSFVLSNSVKYLLHKNISWTE